jgi:hypothetical protein
MTYYDMPTEGVHYFKVSGAQEIPSLINKCSQSQWEDMSNNGRNWYKDNCAPEGSYALTEKIINKL